MRRKTKSYYFISQLNMSTAQGNCKVNNCSFNHNHQSPVTHSSLETDHKLRHKCIKIFCVTFHHIQSSEYSPAVYNRNQLIGIYYAWYSMEMSHEKYLDLHVTTSASVSNNWQKDNIYISHLSTVDYY